MRFEHLRLTIINSLQIGFICMIFPFVSFFSGRNGLESILLNMCLFTVVSLCTANKFLVIADQEWFTFFLFQLYSWVVYSITLSIDLHQLFYGLRMFAHPAEWIQSIDPVYYSSLINLVPFKTIATQLSDFSFSSVQQLGGNILLLAPYSFFLMYYRKKSCVFTFLGVFRCSLAIESTQLLLDLCFSGTRAFDVDDLILNSLGALIGIVFYKCIEKCKGWRFTDYGASRKI